MVWSLSKESCMIDYSFFVKSAKKLGTLTCERKNVRAQNYEKMGVKGTVATQMSPDTTIIPVQY